MAVHRSGHNRSAGLAAPLPPLLSTWVDHRGADILVTEEPLDGPDVVAVRLT
jgi:hypothetical protein